MTEAIWVAIITGAFGALGVTLKVLMTLRKENKQDHAAVVSKLDVLISGHDNLDGRISEVREDVRDLRTDVRAVNQRLDNHIHGTD